MDQRQRNIAKLGRASSPLDRAVRARRAVNTDDDSRMRAELRHEFSLSAVPRTLSVHQRRGQEELVTDRRTVWPQMSNPASLQPEKDKEPKGYRLMQRRRRIVVSAKSRY